MRCVIAGGGTGGHLFPGIAVAEAFVARESGNEVLFIGTEKGIEAKILPGGRFPLKTIQVHPLKGRSLAGKMKSILSLPSAVLEAMSILKTFRPEIVLGVGGYASGPALMAAYLLRIKRAIQEQNVVPGMTNRLLKRFSQKIFVTFEETRNFFPKRKTVVTGNPIRKEFLNVLSAQREGTRQKEKGKFTLFIFGGSAGAHRINGAMIESLDLLTEIKSSLRLIHQTGKEDFDFVSKGYEQKGFEAIVKPFFEDMAVHYEESDLVISRAGAGTISELAVCGKSAVLIPYPHAAHQHQLLNAQRLVKLGAARLIRDEELDGRSLAKAVLELYRRPEEREKMGRAMAAIGRPRAAEEIVDHCYALAGG